MITLGAHSLSRRERAILRAVADGRGELTAGAVPELYLDGRYCSDQEAVYRLTTSRYIAPARRAPAGERVRAVVTYTALAMSA